MAFQFVQILYWLALATWFGGVLFVAVAAPSIFRTVRKSKPILPDVLSVNLEGQHATLLAGAIVGNLLARLAQVELVCAGVLVLTGIAQLFVIDLSDRNGVAAILRAVMLVGAVALVLYHWRIVWPRILRFRGEYIAHADEPELANPAKEQFDAEHRRSVLLLQGVLFLLLGMILFSANISPRGRAFAPAETPSLPQAE
jgi:hypothetical protein